MKKYEVELCYAWQETEDGAYHAFEAVDAEARVDFDAVAEKLADLLDTTAPKRTIMRFPATIQSSHSPKPENG